jgi:hypothetical protein
VVTKIFWLSFSKMYLLSLKANGFLFFSHAVYLPQEEQVRIGDLKLCISFADIRLTNIFPPFLPRLSSS